MCSGKNCTKAVHEGGARRDAAGAMMLWTLGSVPISTSSNSSVQAACASAGGGMTPKKSNC
eukprot:3795017-Pleurochrysis_carterae.AAC.1